MFHLIVLAFAGPEVQGGYSPGELMMTIDQGVHWTVEQCISAGQEATDGLNGISGTSKTSHSFTCVELPQDIKADLGVESF